MRDAYREMVELSLIYLGGDSENKLKIRPPGAMHQARWMARAIYALKMCLLQDQLKISVKDKRALQDVSGCLRNMKSHTIMQRSIFRQNKKCPTLYIPNAWMILCQQRVNIFHALKLTLVSWVFPFHYGTKMKPI